MTQDRMKDTLRVFVVPTEILDVEGLSNNDKLVYMVLRSYANGQDDSCYPSYETISKKASISRPTAIKCVKKLMDMGLLVKEIRKMVNSNGIVTNTSNLYVIVRPSEVGVVKSFNHPPSKTVLPPLVKSFNHPSKIILPELKNLKELDLKDSSSSSKDKIIQEFSSTYPDKPVQQIAEGIKDTEYTTIGQFKGILEHRVVNYQERKTSVKKATGKATRKEVIPEHMDKPYEAKPVDDAKQMAIQEKLERFRKGIQ